MPLRRRYRIDRWAFLRPVELKGIGRKQVGATPFVGRYAGQFKARGLKGLDLARAIVEDIASFKVVELSHRRAQFLWARRSAERIIKTRKVVAAKLTKEDLGKHTNVIMACTDLAQAAVAALRAAGFKALIARDNLHTEAKMLYKEGKKLRVFKIDPSQEKGKRFREMTPAEQRREDSLRNERKNQFAEGASLEEIGITSYKDFFKYAPRELRE